MIDSEGMKSSWPFRGQNNFFLIDRLLKWTLRKRCSTLIYRWTSGGEGGDAVSPQLGPGKLAYIKNDILILFCAKSATDQSFLSESHYECYKKLASRSWSMLFTVPIFFLYILILFCWKIKRCCDCCFPQ